MVTTEETRFLELWTSNSMLQFSTDGLLIHSETKRLLTLAQFPRHVDDTRAVCFTIFELRSSKYEFACSAYWVYKPADRGIFRSFS